ncbi:PREDICTED: uncharacterized protein LOC104604777 [Nelumbo nucifera]|uniref:Uncharacterized protein LOC104604777 n=1 Tax=Nelumbo nucifera TaxID=4432 RepID=A0A1U8AIQ9_NELNU|nr:PREDICTED: uncharacterized protein LOC104604777 [Nelumbo nucifera]
MAATGDGGSDQKPGVMIPLDYLGVQMTSIKLNGENYVPWAKSMEIFLKAKRKVKHVNEDKPSAESLGFDGWEQDAQMMTWLWNSMEPKISVNSMFLDAAKDIWEHVNKLYFGQDDTTRVYQLYQEYFNLQQGNQTLEEYYASMRNLINELNVYRSLTPDVKVQQQQREQLDH